MEVALAVAAALGMMMSFPIAVRRRCGRHRVERRILEVQAQVIVNNAILLYESIHSLQVKFNYLEIARHSLSIERRKLADSNHIEGGLWNCCDLVHRKLHQKWRRERVKKNTYRSANRAGVKTLNLKMEDNMHLLSTSTRVGLD